MKAGRKKRQNNGLFLTTNPRRTGGLPVVSAKFHETERVSYFSYSRSACGGSPKWKHLKHLEFNFYERYYCPAKNDYSRGNGECYRAFFFFFFFRSFGCTFKNRKAENNMNTEFNITMSRLSMQLLVKFCNVVNSTAVSFLRPVSNAVPN